jgi:predicted nucleic acid-binding protein
MVIADTSAWVDFFRGLDAPHVKSLEIALISDRLYIGDLIITELLQGVRNDKGAKEILEIISKLTVVNMVSESLAYKSAENYRFLRSKGKTVRKTIDMLIGTYCIENGMALIHKDSDFLPMEEFLGLRVF